MLTISQIFAAIQFIYHLGSSPLLYFYTEQLFNYPIVYTILRQDPDVFKPTKSDLEFLSMLGAIFCFIGSIYLICFFLKNKRIMLIVAGVQIMLHTQIAKFLKSFESVSYILTITRIEFVLGIITTMAVITDFVLNYGKNKEEEKKKFDAKVEKLKKEYGIKDDPVKKDTDLEKDPSEEASKDNKKNN